MIERDGDRIRVSGPLTVDTVKALYDQGLKAAGMSSLVVDLGGVEAVDSAAVSLMLVWLREARRSQAELSFANVPENLLSLAHLYDVAGQLALGDATPA